MACAALSRHQLHESIMSRFNTFVFVAALVTAAGRAHAAPELLTNEPKRPVAAVARDLNITAEQFVECFRNVHPAPQGERPSGERVHANKQVLLGCLQKANPDITNEKLDMVMDRYRPG